MSEKSYQLFLKIIRSQGEAIAALEDSYNKAVEAGNYAVKATIGLNDGTSPTINDLFANLSEQKNAIDQVVDIHNQMRTILSSYDNYMKNLDNLRSLQETFNTTWNHLNSLSAKRKALMDILISASFDTPSSPSSPSNVATPSDDNVSVTSTSSDVASSTISPDEQTDIQAMTQHIVEYSQKAIALINKLNVYCSKVKMMSKPKCWYNLKMKATKMYENTEKMRDAFYQGRTYDAKRRAYDSYVNAYNQFVTFAASNFGGTTV